MRKRKILTVLLVSLALAALLAGCAENEEAGAAAPLLPSQTAEQSPASVPDEPAASEESEDKEEPEVQPEPQADVGALLEAYLQTRDEAEKKALFAYQEEAAAEAMRRLLARPTEERDALGTDECEAAVLFRLVEELMQNDPAHWEMTNDEKYEVFCAFLEVRCFDDFVERVKSRGHRWNDDIDLWRGYDWEDYGKEMLDCCGYNIPDHILDFIDLERYGRYCGEEYLQEYSDGLIEIQ